MFNSSPDDIPVMTTEGTYIFKLSEYDLRHPMCMAWIVENGNVTSKPFHTSYLIRLDNEASWCNAKHRLDGRIKSAENEKARCTERILYYQGSIDFLETHFFSADDRIGVFNDFAGYQRQGCLKRNKIGLARKIAWNDPDPTESPNSLDAGGQEKLIKTSKEKDAVISELKTKIKQLIKTRTEEESRLEMLYKNQKILESYGKMGAQIPA